MPKIFSAVENELLKNCPSILSTRPSYPQQKKLQKLGKIKNNKIK
jgi:hypothetical protein